MGLSLSSPSDDAVKASTSDNIRSSKLLKDIHIIPTAEIDSVGKEIGRGAYGRVFTVEYHKKLCAVKEIYPCLLGVANEQAQDNVHTENFLRECSYCSVVNHPNIVRFLGIAFLKEDSQVPVIIMELMDESLTAFIERLPKSTSMDKKAPILLDVAAGLKYLHELSTPIIHRDLSPNNILLKKGEKEEVLIAKVSDLGVAKIVKADSERTKRQLTKAPGTPAFMPPEALKIDPSYDVKLDVFSFGGIMLYLATQKWPTPLDQVVYDPDTDTRMALSEIERRQIYLDEMTGEAAGLKSLVESCLKDNPDKRPTMAVVCDRLKVSNVIERGVTSNSVSTADGPNDLDSNPGETH